MSPLPSPARRCASAHTWNQPNGERQFDAGYEFLGCVAGPRNVSESRTFGTEAEGHAWLLSILADPGPLPDPWPNMIVEYDEMGAGWRRATIMSVRPESTFRLSPEVVYSGPSFYCEGSVSVPWTSEYVREVRAADGSTLWTRKAK